MSTTLSAAQRQECIDWLRVNVPRCSKYIIGSTTWKHDLEISIRVELSKRVTSHNTGRSETITSVITRPMRCREIDKTALYLTSDGRLAQELPSAESHSDKFTGVYVELESLTDAQLKKACRFIKLWGRKITT